MVLQHSACRLCLAVSALLALATAFAASAATAQQLRVDVSMEPLSLRVVDDRGEVALEAPVSGLRFARAGQSFRATALLSAEPMGRRLTARFATDDPLPTELAVMVDGHDDGSVSLRLTPSPAVDSLSIAFAATADEAFYGFGERMNGSEHRGAMLINKVEDGPYTAGQCAIVSIAVPDWAKGCRADSTYFPIPWLLSSRGVGFLGENHEVSWFDLGASDPGAWRFGVDAAELRARIFPGPTPADALAAATSVIGRQPPLIAPWQLGVWASPDGLAEVAALHEADVPMSAAEWGGIYLPCGPAWDPDDARASNEAVHRYGLASLAYLAGYLCDSNRRHYDAAVAAGALQVHADGRPYSFRGSGFNDAYGVTFEPVTQFDFTTAAGRDFFTNLLAEPVANGVDGWMEDFGEYTPPDTRPGDPGVGAAELPNLHATLYHCAAHEWTQRSALPRPIVRYQRSGWTGSARCADLVWSGDPTTTFGFTGLASQVHAAMSMGLSGITRWHADVGGYRTLPGDPPLTTELLVRWIEWSTFTSVMRPKNGALTIPGYRRPRVSDAEILPIWRRYAKLHTQLYPYLVAADEAYQSTGLPLVRHLILGYPEDPAVYRIGDQYLFGPDLMVAPVLEAGARSRSVYVPAGRWVDLQRSITFDDDSGAFHLGPTSFVPGGVRVVGAPLGEIPVLIRSGALLPLLSPDVDTLAEYGEDDVVRLSQRSGELRVLAFPDGDSSGAMFSGESLRSVVRPDRWTLSIAGNRPRRYDIEASTVSLISSCTEAFAPAGVATTDGPLPDDQWSFDPATRVLRVALTATATDLIVDGTSCCPGDCNADGSVSIDELLLGVKLALTSSDVSARCSQLDRDGDGLITMDDLVRAVGYALAGCARVE